MYKLVYIILTPLFIEKTLIYFCSYYLEITQYNENMTAYKDSVYNILPCASR
jgi:hypothetical protein